MILPHGLYRRGIVIAIATLTIFLLIVGTPGTFRTLKADRKAKPSEDGLVDPQALNNVQDVKALCKKNNFKPFWAGDASHRKIYDLFLFSHELDWLEIRLNTMAPYVDYFVIVESPTTFTGRQKALALQENWDRFSEFHAKIIHKVVEDPGPSIGMTTWAHEDFFRNSLFHSTFPTLLFSEKEAQEGDVLLVSDVDEIPKPETLQTLRYCDFPDRLTLRSHFYYYSFQWLHSGEQWAHPQATVFRGLSGTLSPNHLRNGIGGHSSWIPFYTAIQRWWQKADLYSAAWHCSSCFATLDEMRAKMSSFSHTPLNTDENRDENTMMERVRKGLDLFGRPEETYTRVEQNQDVPKYVLEHSAKYKYLLDRDGQDAGFTDWTKPPGWLKSDN